MFGLLMSLINALLVAIAVPFRLVAILMCHIGRCTRLIDNHGSLVQLLINKHVR